MKKRHPRLGLQCVLAAASMMVLFGAAWMLLDNPSQWIGREAPRRGDPLKVVGVRSYDWLQLVEVAGQHKALYQTLANEEALLEWVGEESDLVVGSARVVSHLREQGGLEESTEGGGVVEIASSPWALVYREAVPEERTWTAWWQSTGTERLGIPDDPALLLTLARRAVGDTVGERGFDVGVLALEAREARSESEVLMAALHRLALRIRRVDTPEALVTRMKEGELDAIFLPVHWTASLAEGWTMWRPADGFPVRRYYGAVLAGSSRPEVAQAWIQEQASRFAALQMPAVTQNMGGPFFSVVPLPEEERRAIRRIVREMERTGKHIDRSMDNDLLIDP